MKLKVKKPLVLFISQKVKSWDSPIWFRNSKISNSGWRAVFSIASPGRMTSFFGWWFLKNEECATYLKAAMSPLNSVNSFLCLHINSLWFSQRLCWFVTFFPRSVTWSEDLHEALIVERTLESCEGPVDVVINFGTTTRILLRCLKCLAKVTCQSPNVKRFFFFKCDSLTKELYPWLFFFFFLLAGRNSHDRIRELRLSYPQVQTPVRGKRTNYQERAHRVFRAVEEPCQPCRSQWGEQLSMQHYVQLKDSRSSKCGCEDQINSWRTCLCPFSLLVLLLFF